MSFWVVNVAFEARFLLIKDLTGNILILQSDELEDMLMTFTDVDPE